MLVVGIGNEWRGDDGVGLVAARSLRAAAPAGVTVREVQDGGASLLDLWEGRPTVFVVDAVRSGAPPGTVWRLDAGEGPLPCGVFSGCSSHGFGVAEAVELARALGRLPPRLVVYGVEGMCFDEGAGLSSEAAGGTEEVVRRVLAELGR